MTKIKKTGRSVGIAALVVLSTAAHAETDTNAMQAHIGDGETQAASTKANAERMAKAFQDDMTTMSAAMKAAKSTAEAPTTPGVHGRVLGLERLKVLMVKKNEDGTFTMEHVSADADSVKAFAETEDNSAAKE